MIKADNKNITNLKLGDKLILRVYKGLDKVWLMSSLYMTWYNLKSLWYNKKWYNFNSDLYNSIPNSGNYPRKIDVLNLFVDYLSEPSPALVGDSEDSGEVQGPGGHPDTSTFTTLQELYDSIIQYTSNLLDNSYLTLGILDEISSYGNGLQAPPRPDISQPSPKLPL